MSDDPKSKGHPKGHEGDEDDDHDDDHNNGMHSGGGHDEGGHGEPWLISYADLMTLLFGFFVIMYTFASAKNKIEDDSLVKIKKELVQYFGGQYVNPYDNVEKKFQKLLESKPDLSKSLQIKSDSEGVKIVIQSQILFTKGNAELAPDTIPMLTKLIGLIKDAGQNFAIRVSGYTDDIPINSDRYPSNWELSAARAATVLRLFEKEGFDPENLVAAGYGSSHAAFPNHDSAGEPIENNQSANRRVVIDISTIEKTAAIPILGEGKAADVAPFAASEAGTYHAPDEAPAATATPAAAPEIPAAPEAPAAPETPTTPAPEH